MSYNVDGQPVSKPWWYVLTHARRTGVSFRVTNGRRTLRQQAALYRRYRGRRPVAWPTPGAPHIRYGHANHAIDVNALDGGAERLVYWLHRNGCLSAARPVRGEPWHIEVARGELLALARHVQTARSR